MISAAAERMIEMIHEILQIARIRPLSEKIVAVQQVLDGQQPSAAGDRRRDHAAERRDPQLR
jgi:hypothetical protein